MPTIGQLPEATQTTAQDEVPVSQGGVTRSVAVGELLAGTQPAIELASGALLGRVSLGPGGPETVPLGTGLGLAQGTLAANGQDHLSFVVQPQFSITDEVVLNSSGTPKRMTMPLMRGLFTAGSNVTINGSGQIAAGTDPSVSGSLTSLGQQLTTTQATVAALQAEIPPYGYVSLNAQGQVTAPIAADVSLGTVLAAPGGVARTMASRALDSVNVLDFGAKLGGPDCTAAFNAAFAALPSGGGEIFVPAGDFWLSSALVWSGKALTLRGAGKGISRLHFSHTGVGIDIAPGSLQSRVVLRDFSGRAENQSAQTYALARITYPTSTSFGYQTAHVANVEVFGYPNAANGQAPFPQTFTRGLILVGCWSTQVDNLSFFGPPAPAGSTTSYAIELASSTDTRIHALQCYYGNAAVLQSAYCEGIYLSSPLIVGADYVIRQTDETTWPTYKPNSTMLLGLWVTGGECNTNLGTMLLSNATAAWVVGVDITRDGGPNTSQTLFKLTDCSNFNVIGCNIVGGPTGGPAQDVVFGFASTWNSSGNVIGACHVENVATVVNIPGPNGTVALTTFALSTDNVPAATAFQDGTPPEMGNQVTFRSAAASGIPSGTGCTQDHVFAGKQGQLLFRINNIQAAANFLRCQPATSSNPPTLCFDGSDGAVNGTVQTKGGNLYFSAAGGGSKMGNLLALLTVPNASNSIQMQNATSGNLCIMNTNAGGMALQPRGALWLSPQSGLFASGLPTTKPAPGSGQIWNNGGVLSIA